jgi:hypothetical protein
MEEKEILELLREAKETFEILRRPRRFDRFVGVAVGLRQT